MFKDEEAKVSIASERVPGGLLDLILSQTGETSKVTFRFPKRRHFEKRSHRARRSASSATLTWAKALEMEIVFGNGRRDKIHLQEVSNIPGEVSRCGQSIFLFLALSFISESITMMMI